MKKLKIKNMKAIEEFLNDSLQSCEDDFNKYPNSEKHLIFFNMSTNLEELLKRDMVEIVGE